MSEIHKQFITYGIGFVTCLLVTLFAYGTATSGLYSSSSAVAILGVLAIVQLVVQLLCFLHLGSETGPRIKLYSFLFMGLILVMIVAGSIWIMHNLDYNMMHMPAEQKENYMIQQKDKGF